MIGYVDQKDTLFGINAAGYAELVGQINNRTEIVGKLREWQEKNKIGRLL